MRSSANFMGEELGRRIRARDLTRLSMLEFLRDRLHLELGPIRQSIEARLADDEVAGLLAIDLTQPVLFIRLLASDPAGSPVDICGTFYRADRYRYDRGLPPAGAKRRRATVSKGVGWIRP